MGAKMLEMAKAVLKNKGYGLTEGLMGIYGIKTWDYSGYPVFEKRINTELRQELPEMGPVLILANHFNYIDPAWISYSYYKNTDRIMLDFMMQDRFFGDNKALNFLVNNVASFYRAHLISRGKPSKSQMQEFKGILTDKCRFLLVFPAGQRSRSGRYDEHGVSADGEEYRSQIIRFVNSAQRRGPLVRIIPAAISYNNVRRSVTVSFGNEKSFFHGNKDESIEQKANSFLDEIWHDIGCLLKANLDSIGAAYIQGYASEFTKRYRRFEERSVISKHSLKKDLVSILGISASLEEVNIDEKLLERKYFERELEGFIRYWKLKGVIGEFGSKDYMINNEAALSKKTNSSRILKTGIEYAKNRISHHKGLCGVIEKLSKERAEKFMNKA